MSESRTAEELQEQYGISGAVRFEAGPHGLIRAVITTPQAEAELYLQGAHLTRHRPRDQRPVLFLSGASRFEPGRPIGGGVPIVFPWFGPKADDPAAPMHGFARVVPWAMESATGAADGSLALCLRLDATPATHPAWPHACALRTRVTIGARLELALEVTNTSGVAIAFEEALHTYLAVGDVRRVAVRGLEGTPFIDKTDGMRRKRQGPEPVTIAAETDRVYLGTRAACLVEDPAWGRRLVVEKWQSETTVVWNPWIGKARALPDFGDDEWPGMLCIESGNAADNAVSLPPGARHELCVAITSESG